MLGREPQDRTVSDRARHLAAYGTAFQAPGPLTSLISSLHSHSAVKDWWPHFVGAE